MGRFSNVAFAIKIVIQGMLHILFPKSEENMDAGGGYIRVYNPDPQRNDVPDRLVVQRPEEG